MIFSHVSLSYVHVLRLCLWVIFGARTKPYAKSYAIISIRFELYEYTFPRRDGHIDLANRISMSELNFIDVKDGLISDSTVSALAAYNVTVVRDFICAYYYTSN